MEKILIAAKQKEYMYRGYPQKPGGSIQVEFIKDNKGGAVRDILFEFIK